MADWTDWVTYWITRRFGLYVSSEWSVDQLDCQGCWRKFTDCFSLQGALTTADTDRRRFPDRKFRVSCRVVFEWYKNEAK